MLHRTKFIYISPYWRSWNHPIQVRRNLGDLRTAISGENGDGNEPQSFCGDEKSNSSDPIVPKLPPRKLIYSKLPRFTGLKLKSIKLITNNEQLDSAMQLLLQENVLGFDTETMPNFHRQTVATGPHLIQFSTSSTAFLFSTILPEWSKNEKGDGSKGNEFRRKLIKNIRQLLESKQICKIGFDLYNDKQLLKDTFGIIINNTVDLAKEISPSREVLGVSRATAYFFQEYFEKRKSITLSNWGIPITKLADSQILYAANDAYVALRIFFAWKEGRLPWSDEELIVMIENTTGFKFPVAAAVVTSPTTVVGTDAIEYESHCYEIDREIMDTITKWKDE